MDNRINAKKPLSLLLPCFLMACTNTSHFQDELVISSVERTPSVVSYLSLAFPEIRGNELALQVALVRYKEEAINQERWLLQHEIPYQWLLVELNRERWYLLAAGPFKTQRDVSFKRKHLRKGLGELSPMPTIALSSNH